MIIVIVTTAVAKKDICLQHIDSLFRTQVDYFSATVSSVHPHRVIHSEAAAVDITAVLITSVSKAARQTRLNTSHALHTPPAKKNRRVMSKTGNHLQLCKTLFLTKAFF